MRELVLIPLIALTLSCADRTPMDPVMDPEADLMVAADHAKRTQYDVQFTADFECDECVPWEERLTPSMMHHTGDGTNGFFVMGDLEGYALISGGTNAANVNFRTAKGIGSSTASGSTARVQARSRASRWCCGMTTPPTLVGL